MKHKKNNYLALAVSLLFTILPTACSSTGSYNYKNQFKLVEPVENYGTHFSDNNIFIDFDITPKKINFVFRNRTYNPVEIIWSDVKFLNTDGKEVPVSGRGTLFSAKMKGGFTPSPLTVKPGQTIKDSIVPVENVRQWKEWVWYVKPMFNLVDETARNYKGKKLSLDFPVKVNGEVVDYHFTFLVYDVVKLNRTTKG